MKIAIIGVGGVGAMAAWRLALAGHEVIALEQFAIDHDRGSSFGDSRIVRRVYADALYTALMGDAYRLWDELQSQFPGEELFTRSGGLFLGPAEHSLLESAEHSLAASGVNYEILDPATIAQRFPAFTLFPGERAIYEPEMGYARASGCVKAAVQLARKHGTDIRTGFEVVDVARTGTQFCVTSAHGETVFCDRLVITAGPWIGQFLSRWNVRPPLVVTRQAYVHFLPARNEAAFEVGQFPVWIDIATNAYGFPRLGSQSGIKIAFHALGEATTPESVDRVPRDADRDRLWNYAHTRFPDLSDRVSYAKVCLYTNTPDEDFLVDWAPNLEGAVFIGGLSGHGFKFTPLLGEIAARMVTGKEVGYDLSRFRFGRLANTVNAIA